MKKLLIFAVGLMMAVAASAQKGEMAVGGNFNIGIDSGYNNFGIGPKFQYNFAERWRGEASFDYFFKKDLVSQWDLNLNVHFIIPVLNEKLNFYPLAGFTVLGNKVSYDDFFGNISKSTTRCGFNVGAGFEYFITEHVKATAEGKLQWADNSRGVISIGAAYVF